MAIWKGSHNPISLGDLPTITILINQLTNSDDPPRREPWRRTTSHQILLMLQKSGYLVAKKNLAKYMGFKVLSTSLVKLDFKHQRCLLRSSSSKTFKFWTTDCFPSEESWFSWIFFERGGGGGVSWWVISFTILPPETIILTPLLFPCWC